MIQTGVSFECVGVLSRRINYEKNGERRTGGEVDFIGGSQAFMCDREKGQSLDDWPAESTMVRVRGRVSMGQFTRFVYESVEPLDSTGNTASGRKAAPADQKAG